MTSGRVDGVRVELRRSGRGEQKEVTGSNPHPSGSPRTASPGGLMVSQDRIVEGVAGELVVELLSLS